MCTPRTRMARSVRVPSALDGSQGRCGRGCGSGFGAASGSLVT